MPRRSITLYWAKDLKFGDHPDHTLNYDLRALDRHGVLSLNAVAGMGQLGAVEKDIQQVLGFVEFNQGHRYEDFKPGVDKVAAYGIGAPLKKLFTRKRADQPEESINATPGQ